MQTADRAKQVKEAEELLADRKQEIGFAKGLFFGHYLGEKLLHYPQFDHDDEGTKAVADLKQFCRDKVDPVSIDRNAEIPQSVIDGLGKLQLTYGWQQNMRREFDAHNTRIIGRGDDPVVRARDSIDRLNRALATPAMELLLTTMSAVPVARATAVSVTRVRRRSDADAYGSGCAVPPPGSASAVRTSPSTTVAPASRGARPKTL